MSAFEGRDVVVALKGGLGNQLFQWAFGAGLAAEGARVRYDVGLAEGSVHLEIGPIVNGSDLVTLPVMLLRAQRRFGLPQSVTRWTHVTEPRFAYTDPAELPLAQRSLLEGYWQSPRYFAAVEDTVRQTVKDWAHQTLTDEGRAMLAQIRSTSGACSVHVRRGDYLEGGIREVHGLLDADYYRRALSIARTKGAQRFFVFTNDHAWVANELFDGDVVAVPWSVAETPIGEIGLMAACQEHIVANSSFSWWGAWLGGGGRTFAPSAWFASDDVDVSDLVPPEWERIPN